MILGFFLATTISFCFTLVSAWQLPPPNFVKEFANRYQLKSICIYFPKKIEEDTQWLLKWHKEYFSKYVNLFQTPKACAPSLS